MANALHVNPAMIKFEVKKMDLTKEFPESPFEPGHPVSPNKFKGRKKDIIKMIRYLPKVINKGIPEHFFITGKRGMGKTSFVKYIGSLAEDNYQMAHIYVNNEGTNTIDELIQNLVEKMFKEFNKETWGKKIINSFVDNLDEINIKGVGISLKNKPELVGNIKNNFADFLINTCKELKDKKGIFIVIDDINGLSNTPDFANWYKGLFETLDFDQESIPVSFTLVSYQNKFEQLCYQNPSFTRIFNLIEIDHLDDEDIKEFYLDTFNEFNIKFTEDEFLNEMVYYSWGMPLIMQQIGDAVFWNSLDGEIDKDNAYSGIINAAVELGNKQIRNKLNKIKSHYYMGILCKLGENAKMEFTKSEVKEFLSSDELRVFDDFLKRMRDLDIIESIGKENSGEYAFVNRLYFVYFLIIANLGDISKIDMFQNMLLNNEL